MSNLPTSGRLGPSVNRDSEFFWEGARQHRLLAQRCTSCAKLRHPAGPACPFCHSLDWEVAELSGRGELYTYTIVHYPKQPGFDGPAVAVVVELEEGLRFVSNLEDDGAEPLRIGEPVEVFFLDQEEDWAVPQFRRRR